MASTMGRAGVNVLSPVRMAEKSAAPDSAAARAMKDRPMEEDGLFAAVRNGKEHQVKNWLDDVTESANERLPFPTSYSSQDTTRFTPDPSSGMHHSRSQDLPGSHFSPQKASTSISPRLSPRRSPRISPMRLSVESTSHTAQSSGNNTYRSRHSQESQQSAENEHDYSNSVSRSVSAVEDLTSPHTPHTPHNTTANTTANNNINTANSNTSTSTNNEELLAQLEVLKMQNQMLTSRIQRAQLDSHSELERERNKRDHLVTELTQQNTLLSQQLNQTQLDAQAKLAYEKEQFLLSMRQMQVERAQLDERIQKTELLAENEQKLVRMQKAQLHDSLTQLEADKESLLRKLSGNAKLIQELQIRQIGVGSGGGGCGGSGSGGNGVGSGKSDRTGNGCAGMNTNGASEKGSDTNTTNNNNANTNTTSTSNTGSVKHSAARASPSRRALPFPSVFAFTLPSEQSNINSDGGSGGSASSTGTSSDQLSTLQNEQTQLASSLEQLTQQKQSLHTALEDTESTALYNHTQLTLQLSNEKALLELRVSKMCAEQEILAQRLAQAEKTVHEQNAASEAQRAAEHDLAQEHLNKLQQEQEVLLSKINSRGGSKSGSNSASFVHKPDNSGGAGTTVAGSKDGPVSTVDPEAQRLLDAQLAQMTAAMEDLKQKLLLTELASIERENALKEANRREKEELKRTVQKMKEDFLAAKMVQELEYLRDTDTSDKVNGTSGGSGSGKASRKGSHASVGRSNSGNNGSSTNFTPIKTVPSTGRMSPLLTNNNGSPHNTTTNNTTNTTNNTSHTGSNNSSRRNSRLKQPSPGSPSLATKHLASHRSLFDLLTIDYNTQTQGDGSNNILNTTATNYATNHTTNTTSTNAKNKHTFTPHAIHAAELSAMQYHRESSYHKITLPDVTEEGEDMSGSSPRHSPMRSSNANNNNSTANTPSSTAKNGTHFNFSKQPSKSKTIMDLDSDSGEEEEVWGKEVKEVQRGGGGTGGGGGSGSGSGGGGGTSGGTSGGTCGSKRSKKNKEEVNAAKLKLKQRLSKESTPNGSRTVSPTSPVPATHTNTTSAGGSTSTSNANTTMYKPTNTSNTTTANSTTNTPANTNTTNTTNPTTTTLKPTLSTSSHDYSTYNVDQVNGLPAPHSAAAMNDVARLRGFASKQMSLLQSLDQAQRQPIFYAAAYGRVEALQYLLQTLPDQGLGVQFGLQWVRGDIHGDTPVHAAASSGCATSTDLLLSALAAQNSIKVDTGVKSIADLRNNMQMTPAHLCSSAEALDVVYRYQADLEAQDIHSRTPLFIACAMNREVCAEYLIDCLDQAVSDLIIEGVNTLNNSLNRGEGLNLGSVGESANHNGLDNTAEVKTISVEDKMMHTDRRGDTPLHAAACNGAVECLLLLLQHGIDPRLKNLSGLKAIDLAVRNRHKKCKEILAEYHLHYCTSGDFDSVLFLATLEGHRRIADAAHLRDGTVNSNTANTTTTINTAHQEIAEYRIIQENPHEHNTNTTSAGHAHTHTSNGTVSGTTAAGGKVRFANPFGISTEDVNTVDKDNAETTKALHKAAQSMFSLRANKSMRLQRLGAWIAYHDTQSDSVFWYNHETSTGQWEEPAEVQAIKLQLFTHSVIGGGGNGVTGRDQKQDIFEKTLPAKMSMRIKRYGDWIEYITESGRTFYYNDKDGSFQWEPPFATDHTTTKARGGGSGSGGGQNKNAASTATTTTTTTTAPPPEEHNAHYPWRAYIDPESGSVFWYNEVTFVSQWELPAEFEAEAHEANTAPSHRPSRSDKTRESLDLSHSNEVYNIDTHHQKNETRGAGRRSRLRSASFEDEHVVAVWDHENDLGI